MGRSSSMQVLTSGCTNGPARSSYELGRLVLMIFIHPIQRCRNDRKVRSSFAKPFCKHTLKEIRNWVKYLGPVTERDFSIL